MSLYHEALAADAAFTDALIAAYGEKRASEMRYAYKHADAAVIEAAERKLKADAAWLAFMRGG